MGDSQLLGILLIAMVAGVILFRLYTVLGRRTGNEREPQERFRPFGGAPSGSSDNVVALPDRSAQGSELGYLDRRSGSYVEWFVVVRVETHYLPRQQRIRGENDRGRGPHPQRVGAPRPAVEAPTLHGDSFARSDQ